MNKTLIFAIALASTASLMSVHAQTYQWKDSSGKTVISDTPPPSSTKGSRAIKTLTPSPVTSTATSEGTSTAKPADTSASAPLTTAEKELEFRKRQQETREKTEKAEKEANAAREKRETCERARSNYRMLQSDVPVAQADKRGEVQVMNNAQRQQELERTRRIMQDACK